LAAQGATTGAHEFTFIPDEHKLAFFRSGSNNSRSEAPDRIEKPACSGIGAGAALLGGK
jgi:hypothetical protein